MQFGLSNKSKKTIELFENIESILEIIVVFLLPIFFLPIFNEVVYTAKLYLLAGFVVLFFAIKGVKILVTKEISWKTTNYDNTLILVGLAYVLALVINAPNKIAALTDIQRGAAFPLLLIILFFLLPKNNKVMIAVSSVLSLITAGIISTLSYIGVFSNVPSVLQFLSLKTFTPTGGYITLGMLSLFFAAVVSPHVISPEKEKQEAERTTTALDLVVFSLTLALAVFSAYVVLRNIRPQFLPYSATWQTFIETLKMPRTGLFGTGPANFTTMFTTTKTAAFNNIENLWNTVPQLGGSGFLHIATELGIFGLIAYILLLTRIYAQAKKNRLVPAFIVLGAWMLLLPLNQLMLWALLLLLLLSVEVKTEKKMDIQELPIAYGALSILALSTAATLAYFTYIDAKGQYTFQQSVIAANRNRAKDLYDLQLSAINQNPYNERFHIAFAQTNLLLANNIIRNTQNQASKKGQKLSKQQQQNVTQLIQQAIAEARNAVVLNPLKAHYWANLGEVYRNVLRLAQGADVWAVSSYQRAIARDPRNPVYYFNLGSIYYALGNYQESVRFFENAVSLKSDIPNYYYNLAWAYYKNGQYPEAVRTLKNTLALTTDKKSNDYKTVQKDLKTFEQKLKESEKSSSQENTQNITPETLTQPSPAVSITPAIELPKDSAPPTQNPNPEEPKK